MEGGKERNREGAKGINSYFVPRFLDKKATFLEGVAKVSSALDSSSRQAASASGMIEQGGRCGSTYSSRHKPTTCGKCFDTLRKRS